jgi:hypothetical protein
MATTPEAVEQDIVANKAKIQLLEQQVQAASGDRELLLLLLQELTALRQELIALRQKEVLLMQQQAGAAGSQRS